MTKEEEHSGHNLRAKPQAVFKKLMILSLPTILLSAGIDVLVGSWEKTHDDQSFRVVHPYFHHGFRSNLSAETEWGGVRYPMITNSLGLRDQRSREIRPTPVGKRVVLLGDSFIEGLGVGYEESVAGLLAGVLEKQDTELLNAAAVSYSPLLYYLKAKFLFEKAQIETDKLIVFIDISDIQDEIHYASFQPTTSEPPGGARFMQTWQTHSFLARRLKRNRKKAISNQFDFKKMADIDVWLNAVEAYRMHDNPQQAEKGRWDWTVSPKDFEAWGKSGLKLAKENMDRLHTLCLEHKVRLTLVVYPSPTQIFANDLKSLQVSHWQQFCADRKIGFMDLFPLFINPEFSGPKEVYQSFFLRDDTHWNAKGNRLVAGEIYRQWALTELRSADD